MKTSMGMCSLRLRRLLTILCFVSALPGAWPAQPQSTIVPPRAGLPASARGPVTDSNLPPALIQGILEEEGNLNLPGALQQYQAVLTQFEGQRRHVANALFRLGECYRKLGQTNEALACYQRLAREFADQAVLVQLGQKWIAEWAPPLASEPPATIAGTTIPVLSPAQAKLLEEEIKLVETQLTETQKRLENGKAESDELVALHRELIQLQRKLPRFAGREQQKELVQRELGLVDELLKQTHKRIEVGAVAPISLVPFQRAQLTLQRELLAIESGQGDSSSTTPKAVRNDTLTLTVSPASTEPPAATEEEAWEIQRVKAIIQNSPDLINARGEGGATPLHQAAGRGQLAVATYLLDHQADLSAKENQGHTPLQLAARNGHKAMVELLLDHGAELENTNYTEFSALYLAAANGHRAVVETLIQRGAKVNAQFNFYVDNVEGLTPLHGAVRKGYRAVAELLLAQGAQVNARTRATFGATPREAVVHGTPLQYAAERGDLPLVELLLARGADPNARDQSGLTPLHWAACKNQTQVVEVLLAKNANPNLAVEARAEGSMLVQGFMVSPFSWTGSTPLHFAARQGNPAMMDRLLFQRADLNAADGQGNRPLHWAIVSRNREAVSALLAHHPDLNAQDIDQRTPLHRAVEFGQKDLIQVLLDQKPDLERRDKNSLTPLQQIMTRTMDTEIAELLLSAGANPNVVYERTQETPLFWAIQRKNPELVRLLLKHHAQVNILNQSGKTPLSLAQETKDQAIINLLVKAGANENLERLAGIWIRRPSRNYQQLWFDRGTNEWNRFTLMELIADFYAQRGIKPENNRATGSPTANTPAHILFPDLSRIRIHRLRDPARPTLPPDDTIELKIDLDNMLQAGQCTNVTWLEWGDTVEIPETDHALNETWQELPSAIVAAMQKCLMRTMQIKVKDKVHSLQLAPFPGKAVLDLRRGVSVSVPPMLTTFWLRDVVQGSGLLRASSDTTRIKVIRPGPDGANAWTFDLAKLPNREFWLREGDLIQIPEKEDP